MSRKMATKSINIKNYPHKFKKRGLQREREMCDLPCQNQSRSTSGKATGEPQRPIDGRGKIIDIGVPLDLASERPSLSIILQQVSHQFESQTI